MKTIGILGGMAPESTASYYRRFIQISKDRERGRNYPPIIIYSLNFADFCRYLDNNEYQKIIELLLAKIDALSAAGADFCLMASNTPHMFYDGIVARSPISVLSIVEATAKETQRRGFNKVGLLGTKFSMEQGFYQEGFEERGISVVTPEKQVRDYLHRLIMDELTEGQVKQETTRRLIKIIRRMKQRENIEGIVLGCTELPLVLNESELGFPVLDTVKIHVQAAFDYAKNTSC